MKLSTKTRYSLRALVIIALRQQGGPVSIHTIAEHEGISTNYLVQLLSKLRAAGLIESVRGPAGGFRLKVDPAAISVADIFRAVNEKMVIAHCYGENGAEPDCARLTDCLVYPFWNEVSQQFRRRCEETTLADLLAGRPPVTPTP